MPLRRKKSKPPPAAAPGGLADLPSECLDAIVELLPPNCIPLALRQLNKELRRRYLQHTTVLVKGDGYLPAWAVLAALPQLHACGQHYGLMAAMARHGNVEGMQQLAQHPLSCRSAYWNGELALCAAASAGHLDAVGWLVKEQGCSTVGSNVCSSAASGGRTCVLQWLRRQGVDCCNGRVLAAAAGAGHVDTVVWLLGIGCARTIDATEAAAENGHVGVLQALLESGCPVGYSCGYVAALNGHLAILQHLRQQGLSLWNASIGAARGGQKEVLLWLRDMGQQWTAYTCAVAAETGEVGLLRWMREQTPPCPWDEGLVLAVARSQHDQGAAECLEYALSNGCPWNVYYFRQVQRNPKLRHVQFPGVRRSARGHKD